MSTINPSNPAAGVYTKIVDLSERPANVPTSIGAFIGASPRGPVGERVLVTDYADFVALFGEGSTRFGYMRHCVQPFMQISSRSFVTRLINGALTAGAYLTADDMNAQNPQLAISVFTNEENQPTGKNDPFNTEAFTPSTPGGANILGLFCAANPGLWNNSLSIQVKPSNPSGVQLRGRGHNPLHFLVEVFENKVSSSTPASESFLVTRHEEKDEEGNSLYIEDVINNNSNLIRYTDNTFAQEIQTVSTASVLFSGATDGAPLTNDQIALAWDLYDDPEEISIDILVNCGYTHHNVQHKMEQVARLRGDSIAILDLPSDKEEVADAINYKRNILNMSSKYAALYGPRVMVYDQANDKRVGIPISGYVAASFAKADRDRALWFAPAGIELGTLSVLGTTQHYDQGARDAMDLAQINVVRKLPANQGYVIWGQSTTQTQATSLQYVNVMRLTQFILKRSSASVLRGVFNPNDSLLRDRLKGVVESILQPIVRGRGIYEFQVICDSRNNTPATIANGDLVLDIVFDPVIATKRIHVTFNINPTGSRVTEN
jgi:phage tail sheath protein FI